MRSTRRKAGGSARSSVSKEAGFPEDHLDAEAARKALQSVRKDDIVSRLADISGHSQSEFSKMRKADVVQRYLEVRHHVAR